MNVNFTPQALEDLQAIHSYISEENPSAANNVISRIRQTAMMFSQFPLLGRDGLVKGTKEFVVVGLPYVIIYKISSETDVDILTVIHGRQKYP